MTSKIERCLIEYIKFSLKKGEANLIKHELDYNNWMGWNTFSFLGFVVVVVVVVVVVGILNSTGELEVGGLGGEGSWELGENRHQIES